MYAHPATRANVERLRGFGYRDRGAGGRLARVGQRRAWAGWRRSRTLVAAVVEAIGDARCVRPIRHCGRPPVDRPPVQDLAGWHVVVTAGGTAEPIDPVRFIGNRSSGRMGVAIAAAALARGARVTLIHGMTSVPLPGDADLVDAPTTADMRDAVLAALPDADALVMAAAVADFRPARSRRRQARAWRRPDPRARAHRGHPGRGLGGGRATRRPARVDARPSWSASRPRPARSIGRPRRPPARVSTCSSPTTCPSRAQGSALTPTG